MLLNLIIAVMTTTATDMNMMPWRQAVCTVELWDEILGIEAQVLTMLQCCIWLHNLCKHKSKQPGLTCNWIKLKRKFKTYKVVHYRNEESD